MKEKFAVIGLGRFGRTLATTLAKQGAEVLAIDDRMENVSAIADEVAIAVQLDATDSKALEGQQINDYNVAVVAIGSNFESMLLTTVNLLNLGVPRIIARAMNKTQRSILYKLGIAEKDIISPEIQVGVQLAEQLLHPHITTFLRLGDTYEIAETALPPGLANQSLLDLDLRRKYNLNVVAIEREVYREIGKGHEAKREVLGITDPNIILLEGDTMVLIGRQQDIQKFIDLNK